MIGRASPRARELIGGARSRIPSGMEIARHDRRAAPRMLILLAAGIAGAAAAAMVLLDAPVARLIGRYELLALWDRVLLVLDTATGLEAFSHLSSIALVLGMLITVAVPRWRGQAPVWMWIAATHLLSRLATLELKVATGRLRPGAWLANGGTTWFRDGLSFPSGHVAIYASLLVPLAVAGPRARPLLAIVVFSMAARIGVNAHFVSDTLGAVALVLVISWATSWVIRPLAPRAR